MRLAKRVRAGVMLAEALVGLAVAFALLMGLCTILQHWRRDAAALEGRARLVDAAARVMRAAAREDFEALLAVAGDAGAATAWGAKAAGLDPQGGLVLAVQVSATDEREVLAVRVEVREGKATVNGARGVRVALERLVARPEASLRMEGVR